MVPGTSWNISYYGLKLPQKKPLIYSEARAGEMAQGLKALVALPEDPTGTLGSSQLSAIPVPGDQTKHQCI